VLIYISSRRNFKNGSLADFHQTLALARLFSKNAAKNLANARVLKTFIFASGIAAWQRGQAIFQTN